MKITLIYGGLSSEREVSIRGGKRVYEALKSNNFDVDVLELNDYYDLTKNIKELKKSDLVFLVLHGNDGECGKIQGFLDSLNINYVGSDLLTSSICFNKRITFDLVEELVNIPEWEIVKCDNYKNPLNQFPVIIKPISEGSSVDINICDSQKNYLNCLKSLYKKYDELIVQKLINGKEITISMIEKKDEIIILPILEIKPKNRFYDYEAKYTKGMTEFIVPADISDNITEDVKNRCKIIFEKLKCKGFARIDGIICDNEFYFFEVNTIPGLTELSDLPISAKAAGINFNDLIKTIVGEALDKTEV